MGDDRGDDEFCFLHTDLEKLVRHFISGEAEREGVCACQQKPRHRYRDVKKSNHEWSERQSTHRE